MIGPYYAVGVDSAPIGGLGAGASVEGVAAYLLVDFTKFSGAANVRISASGYAGTRGGITSTFRIRVGGTGYDPTYSPPADGTVVGSTSIPATSGFGYGLDYVYWNIVGNVANPGAVTWVKLTMQSSDVTLGHFASAVTVIVGLP